MAQSNFFQKMTLSPTEKQFCTLVSKIVDFASPFGYKPENLPIKLLCGKFSKVPFLQVWISKGATRIAVTEYNGGEDDWFKDQATQALLLELAAEPALGLPIGTAMLKIDAPNKEIESMWKFSRVAVGPCDERIKKLFGVKLLSILLADDEKQLYKIYASYQDETEFNTILIGLSKILNKVY